MVSVIEKRKKEHLELCVKKDVLFHNKTTLFEDVELSYKALPEISMSEVDLSTSFLGKKFSFPFLASAITGGAQVSKKVNLEIASACQELGVGMGLGSMRAMIQQPSLKETYYVRGVAPDIFLAGNLGAAQLKQFTPEKINEALDSIEADALAIHVNAAQEAVQPEGDVDFTGLITKIAEYSEKISVPVYVKEVGHGISFEVASALRGTSIKAIDVQGAGGTSWTAVDALRHKEGFGLIFRDFGLPTAVSLIETKTALSGTDKKVIASGGIRNGLEAVKALVLGADLCGNALPLLKVQQKKGTKGVREYLLNFKKEMQITSFLIGCKDINEIHSEKALLLGKLRDWVKE
ncbi:MAG: type 2 isopentenyl-diphosphate Delta-isomerase [Candidatus Iainarchaeum sp.]|jgi:isopentenyl-diphosphate delta-isomerase|nr:MAG: Isopentenyl-diphosphate delta-isomerase [archaeon ADurb.Bin336]